MLGTCQEEKGILEGWERVLVLDVVLYSAFILTSATTLFESVMLGLIGAAGIFLLCALAAEAFVPTVFFMWVQICLVGVIPVATGVWTGKYTLPECIAAAVILLILMIIVGNE